jgi:hypothetical protein
MVHPRPILIVAARAALVFSFLLFSLHFLSAQEQAGMRLERYSGMYGAALNPAQTGFTPHPWELSLGDAFLYLDNNYAFIHDASVPKVLRESDRLFSISDTSAETPIPPDAILSDFYQRTRPFYGVVRTRIGGPGFSVRLGESHVVGLQTAFRTEFSSYGLPSVFQYSRFSQLPQNIPQEIDPLLVAGMSWGELGLHYSYRNWDASDERLFSIGISPKLLLGYEGFYSKAGAQFDYTPGVADTASFARAQWNYGLTLANTRSDNSDSIKLRRSGMGGSVDLGAAWAMPAEDGDTDTDYLWKFGVSILDLGAVRFNKDAQAHRLAVDSNTVVAPDAFDGADDAEGYIQDLSAVFLGSPTASLEANTFTIGLPTALSAQFDFRVRKYLYVGGVIVQRIPIWKYTLKRPNMLALVPRFEHQWFSASLPIVLDDYRALRVGFAARLAYLTIGSDNLGSWLGQKQLSGTDIYVGLKINGFQIGSGKNRGGRSGMSWRSRRKIKCYEF